MSAEIYDLDLTLNEPVGNGGQDVLVVYEVERGAGTSKYALDPRDQDHLTIHDVMQDSLSIYGALPAEIHAEIAMAVSEDWKNRKLNEETP